MPKQRDLFDTNSYAAPTKGIWLYRKNTVSDTEVKRTLQQIPLSYGPDCMVYTDDPDSLAAWLRLKTATESCEGGLLILSSLKDIGRTVGSVADEVAWITERGLEVIVMDCPSTFVFDKPQINGMVFHIVAEVWDNLMRTVAIQEKKPKYPDGWDILFKEWQNHKIKTKQFVAETGFSVSTLQNRIDSYRPISEGEVKIFPLRQNQKSMYEYV